MSRLGDICVISAGQGAPQGDSNYCDRGYGVPFIKAGDLSDLLSGKSENELQCVNDDVVEKYKLKLYPSGSILFAKSGMSCMKGYIYRTQYPCYVVSHLAIVIPEKVDGEYLKFYFQYHKPNSLIKDSAYPSISLQDISNIELKLPSREEQEDIAASLNKISELISLHKLQLAKLDELVKARFVELFGTLENPVQEFKKATLKELCTKITDGKHGGCTQEEGTERYFVGAREIYDNAVHYDTAPEINLAEFEKDYKRCNVEIGDFLIVNTGATIGKSAIAIDPRTEYTLLQKSVALLKAKRELLNPVFLQYCYKVNEKMYKVESASAQPNLLLSKINSTEIYVPQIELQNQFAAFVEQTDKSKSAIQQSLDKLETLKKALMQKYFG